MIDLDLAARFEFIVALFRQAKPFPNTNISIVQQRADSDDSKTLSHIDSNNKIYICIHSNA